MVTQYPNFEQLCSAVWARMKNEKVKLRMLPHILNRFLPEKDRVDTGRIGLVSVQRWLKPEKPYHCEPRAAIALALYAFAYLVPPGANWNTINTNK
jgi:hypothetical protein